jgi:hypothetical protein
VEEPEVMLGTFDVHSTPATILFDSRASHSLVNSPGGSIPASYRCLPISLILRGVEFKVSPIVLGTAGIDLILGMDWMMQQQAEIQCKGKSVVLIPLKGDRIRVDVKVQKQETATVN